MLFLTLASIVFCHTWTYSSAGPSIGFNHTFISFPLSLLHDTFQVIAVIAIAFQAALVFSYAAKSTRHTRNRLKEGCILTSFATAALALVFTTFLSTYYFILGALDFRLPYSTTSLISMTSTDTRETVFSIYSVVSIGFLAILYLAIAFKQTMQAQVWLSMCSIAFATTMLFSTFLTRTIDVSARSFGFLHRLDRSRDPVFGLEDGIQHAEVRAAIVVFSFIISWLLYSHFSGSILKNWKQFATLFIVFILLPSHLFFF